MLPDWVSNPGSLTYKSDALPIALRGPASRKGAGATKSELEGKGYTCTFRGRNSVSFQLCLPF